MAAYGLSTRAAATAHSGHIQFRKACEDCQAGWTLGYCYLHEMGHCGDWVYSKFLSLTEKFELYKKVIERVKSENRYKFEYVEKIKNRVDRKNELYLKTREYFAEIVSAYLGGQPIPKEDTEIVESLIRKKQPHFNQEEALKMRYEIIKEAEVIELEQIPVAIPVYDK